MTHKRPVKRDVRDVNTCPRTSTANVVQLLLWASFSNRPIDSLRTRPNISRVALYCEIDLLISRNCQSVLCSWWATMSLSPAALEEEIASMTGHANTLTLIPVVYPNDHVPDPDEVDLPHKLTPFPVDLPPPPEIATTQDGAATRGNCSLAIKSLKPPVTFTLVDVSGTDTVLSIKERLALEHSRAPNADIQRLLLKGKALADNKLFKEYLPPSSEGGEVNLTLMIKTGASWDAEEKPTTTTHPRLHLEPDSLQPVAGRKHARTPSEGQADQFPVPSLTLSTPGSPTSVTERAQVPLDIADPDYPHLIRPGSPSSPGNAGISGLQHALLTRTEFWVHFRDFLQKEVSELYASGYHGGGNVASDLEVEADELLESFLLASKGSLEATEVARIRDAVDIKGMAGT